MAVNNAINSQQALSPSDSPTFSTVTATASFVGPFDTSVNSSNADFYPIFVASNAGGGQALQLATGISFNPSVNSLSLSGINLAGSPLAGIDSVINIDSSFQDGNYINIGGFGRSIGIMSGGVFFMSYAADYNATTNVYEYASTGNGCSFLELESVAGHLKYADAGIQGDPVTALSALSWDTTNGDVSIPTGDLGISTAGKGLSVKSGANARIGSGAVLVGGTVTVNTTAVLTGDIIFLSCTTAGGTQGVPRISAIVNATSFTITSSSAIDTSTYDWMIVRPT